MEAKQYVMRQGDDGDSYYIILEGQVQIFINKDFTQEYTWMELLKTIVNFFIPNTITLLKIILRSLNFFYRWKIMSSSSIIDLSKEYLKN